MIWPSEMIRLDPHSPLAPSPILQLGRKEGAPGTLSDCELANQSCPGKNWIEGPKLDKLAVPSEPSSFQLISPLRREKKLQLFGKGRRYRAGTWQKTASTVAIETVLNRDRPRSGRKGLQIRTYFSKNLLEGSTLLDKRTKCSNLDNCVTKLLMFQRTLNKVLEIDFFSFFAFVTFIWIPIKKKKYSIPWGLE